mgnify:CR=1 FL=1
MSIPARSGRLFATILIACLAALHARPAGGLTRDEVVAAVRGTGIRTENSEGERKLLAFIDSEARRRDLQTRSIPIKDYSDGHSFSSILEVRHPGTGPGTLALLFPVGGTFSWGDGAEGISAAFELMDRLGRSPPPLEVRFAFLGADEELKGSRAYAAYCADEISLAALRVEVSDRESDRVDIFIGGTGTLSPNWLLDSSVRAVRGKGLLDSVRSNRSMIQRLGVTDAQTPLDPWFRRNLPAITLRAGIQAGPGSGALSYGIVEVLEHFVRSMDRGIPDRWDRQYLLFEALGVRLALRETLYLAGILVLYAALGLVFVFDSLRNRELLAEELSRVPRAAAALGIVSAVLFLCILASAVPLRLILSAAGSPEFWKVHPVAFSALRMALVLSLFTALASLCVRIGLLPRNAERFRGIAVVVLGADVLLVSAVRLSLSLVFLWPFVIAILGRRLGKTLRRSWPSAVSLPLTLLPMGFLAADLIRDPEYAAFARFLAPDAGGAAFAVFLSLPFLLLFVGLGEAVFGTGFYKAKTSAISAAAFAAISLAGGAWLVSDARGYRGNTDISIREYSDESAGTGRILVDALRPLPPFDITKGELRFRLTGGASSETVKPIPSDSRIRASLDRQAFLDRVQLSLSLWTEGDPAGIRILIPSIESGSVYDASFPFRSTENGSGVEIFVGARPPDPVVVSLTVSRDFSASAEISAVFRSPAIPLVPAGAVRIMEYLQESRRTLRLSAGESSL